MRCRDFIGEFLAADIERLLPVLVSLLQHILLHLVCALGFVLGFHLRLDALREVGHLLVKAVAFGFEFRNLAVGSHEVGLLDFGDFGFLVAD